MSGPPIEEIISYRFRFARTSGWRDPVCTGMATVKQKGPHQRAFCIFQILADQGIALMAAAKRLFCRETVFLRTMRLSAIESIRLCDT